MSIKAYCDICNDECNPKTNKRWENVRANLGLEVIILKGAQPINSETHVCEGCITEMFWAACNRSKDNPISKAKEALLARQEDFAKLQTEFKAKQHEVEARIEQLKQQKEEMDLRRVRLDLRDAKITAVEEAAARWERAVAQAEARGYQRAIDEREYPEYIDSIEANALRRAGI